MSELRKAIRKLIRADGTEISFGAPLTLRQIHAKLSASELDTVRLTDGVHVMLVDDLSHMKGLPVNEAATQLYWEKCGGPVDHVIVGDVVIVPDRDFE